MSTFPEYYSEIIGSPEKLKLLEEFIDQQWTLYLDNFELNYANTGDVWLSEEDGWGVPDGFEWNEDKKTWIHPEFEPSIFDDVDWGEDGEQDYSFNFRNPTIATFSLSSNAWGGSEVIKVAIDQFPDLLLVTYEADQEQDYCWIYPPGLELGYWAYPRKYIGANHNQYFKSYIHKKFDDAETLIEAYFKISGSNLRARFIEIEQIFNNTAILTKAGFISSPQENIEAVGTLKIVFVGDTLGIQSIEGRLRDRAPKLQDNFLYEEICLLRGEDGTDTMQVLCRQGELDGLVGQLQEEFPLITIEQTWEALITDSE